MFRRTSTALGAAGLAVLLSGCWFQPRHDAGRTNWNPHESQLTGDTVAGAELEERWQAPVSDVATSVHAPIAVDGTVYATTGFAAWVTAVDAATGEVRWQRSLFDPTYPPLGQSLTAPAWDDGTLLVGATRNAATGVLYTLDPATGATLASVPTTGPITDLAVARGEPAVLTRTATRSTIDWAYDVTIDHAAGTEEAPGTFAIDGRRILWSKGEQAFGFSPACPPGGDGGTCAPDWAVTLGGKVHEVVVLGGGQAVFSHGLGYLTVLDTATGAVQWTARPSAAWPGVHIAAVADGRIVVTEPNDSGFPVTMAVLDANGCGGATTCTTLWTARFAPFSLEGALVAAGDLVWAVGTMEGATGSGLHAFDLDGCGAATCGPVSSTPGVVNAGPAIVHDGRLLMGGSIGVTAYGLP